MLAEYIQYKYIYPTDTYFPTQRPKGAQTPSNCHISPKCWQNISSTNICYIVVSHVLKFTITITIKISLRSCLCGLRALGWGIQILWCQIVHFWLRCQIVRFHMVVPNCPFLHDGAKLSAVPNCPFYMTVPNCPGAKLSVFTLRCQIVRFSLRCQIVRGAKLSAVPNCPRIPGRTHFIFVIILLL